jgi:hypothetical protein
MSTNKSKTPFAPIRLMQSPVDDINSPHNFNKTFTPLISNSLNHNKSSNFNANSTFSLHNKNSFHPIEFYALGKIPNGTVYPTFQWNKGIKSTSNNIIERNVLSINTKKFNQIYSYKNLSNLSQQNVTENNYMKPIKLYKTTEKYNLPKNTTNFETYKIMKEKYFSKDIQSTIAKGKKINKSEFITEKENTMKNKDENKNIKMEEVKGSIEKENKNELLQDKKSKTSCGFFYKDPNDYSKKLLMNNIYGFEQNNIQMIKPKKYKFEGKV